jgi:hypothetical protein
MFRYGNKDVRLYKQLGKGEEARSVVRRLN